MLEFLRWIDARRRTYGEAIDAWRSNCPREPVWDDAVIGGLVQIVQNGNAVSEVVLTERGRAMLSRYDAPRSAHTPTA